MLDQLWLVLKQNATILIGLLSLGIVIALIALLTDGIKETFKEIGRKIFFNGISGSPIISAETYTKVLNELLELRIKLKADRAYIFQFHNGEHFGGMNPRWKMTQTYETCVEGVTYEGKNLVNLDVTLFWDILQIFYIPFNKLSVEGISLYTDNLQCPLKDCVAPKQIFLIDVRAMDGNRGFTKSMLMQQGIYYMLVCPIVNPAGEIVGFIGVDYCTEDAYDEVIKKKLFEGCLICQTGTNVALAWALDPGLRKKAITINRKLIKQRKRA